MYGGHLDYLHFEFCLLPVEIEQYRDIPPNIVFTGRLLPFYVFHIQAISYILFTYLSMLYIFMSESEPVVLYMHIV